MDVGLSGKYYRVATLSKLYLSVIGMKKVQTDPNYR